MGNTDCGNEKSKHQGMQGLWVCYVCHCEEVDAAMSTRHTGWMEELRDGTELCQEKILKGKVPT